MAERYRDLGRGPVSTEALNSAGYFEAEREAVFKQSWLVVGRETDLPNPGDYFVKRLDTLKTTVVVTRDQAGILHAMHDVCPHRGMHVCGKEQAGNRKSKTLTRQFHGWVYGMDGRALSIPDVELFYSLDKAKLRMPPLAAATWKGFIFVNLDPAPELTVLEHLGPVVDELAGYPFNDYTTI